MDVRGAWDSERSTAAVGKRHGDGVFFVVFLFAVVIQRAE